MRKYITILLSICVIACTNKKSKVVDNIKTYHDSLGMARAQLMLLFYLPHQSVSQDFESRNKSLHQRLYVKNRMWHYQWVLDSLTMELKRY